MARGFERTGVYPQNGVPIDLVPITPNDSTDLPEAIIGLRCIGAAGDVVVYTRKGGSSNPRTISIAVGETIWLSITRVLSTGTTATSLRGFI